MPSSTDLAKLVVSLEAQTAKYQRGLDRANKKLDRFTKRQDTQIQRIAGGFIKLAAAIGGVVSVSRGLSKLTQVSREFDILNAQLVTATGSTAGAAVAFKELEKFAATTPFALDQSVTAFQKLVNLGLTPSERALRSYGNTASALGKDLSQFIEAVADASVAEFERLKEFGIKARNQGDTIAFTFRGVTTQVKNSAAAIEQFLINIGEVEFAGALEERAKTLDGAISNLGDSWDGLFRTISRSGIGELIADSFRLATSALNDLSASISAFSGTEILSLQSEIAKLSDRIDFAESNALVANAFAAIGQSLDELKAQRAALVARLGELREQEGKFGSDLGQFKVGEQPALDFFAPNLESAGARRPFDPTGGLSTGFQEATEKAIELNEATADYNRMLLEAASNAPDLASITSAMYDQMADRIEAMVAKQEVARDAFIDLFSQNMVQAAEGGFDSILQSWTRTIQQMVARLAASKLFDLLKGIGGGGTGSFGGFITSVFGGGKQAGGPVSPGRTFLVGERGPELFTPPTAGRIHPAGSFGSSMVFNIDATGAEVGVEQRIEAAVERAVARANQQRDEDRRRGL